LTTEFQNEEIFGRRRIRAGSPRNRWEEEVRKNVAKLLCTKIGTQRQDIGETGEKQGRKNPGNRPYEEEIMKKNNKLYFCTVSRTGMN